NGSQVLGVSTTASESASATPSASTSPTQSPAGQVEGASTIAATCARWREYIPWILLVIQALFVFFIEYRYRGDSGWTKHYLDIGMTILSIILFYILRECPCYGQWSWLAWLCKWYWVVAILVTLLIKGFSYAFMDETVEKEEEPDKKPRTGEAKQATD